MCGCPWNTRRKNLKKVIDNPAFSWYNKLLSVKTAPREAPRTLGF